jgi:alanyl aminopeptidase
MAYRVGRGSAVVFALVAAWSCARPHAPPLPPSQPAAAQGSAPDPAPPPRADGRLPGGVVPTDYRVELTIDPRQRTFPGHASIGVQIERPTRAIVMHARGITVHLAAVEQAGQKLWTKPRSRMSHGGKVEPEELVLTFDRELSAGAARIELEYEAPFGTTLRGVYRVEEAGQAYAFTQFEPTDARRAFPCFDEPGFKVPFELSVTVPEKLTAFSNTPLVKKTEQPESGLVTYTFERSQPLPTYLVALAVGTFDVVEARSAPVPLRLIAVRGRAGLGELALQTASAQLELLAKYFGSAYPYKKLDLLAVPNFGSGAMENAGLITFREELLLLDPKQASANARRGLFEVMAHELAHHWFGNLVTMAWWDDVWLNESFATWMSAKIVDQGAPELGAGRELLIRRLSVMQNDSLKSARRIRQPVRSTSEAMEAFDGITYQKGASVLGMVEHWLGEQTFQQGVRAYLEKHAWKNATSQDLFSALDAASGKNVSAVMNGFIDQTGVPLVRARTDCRAAEKPPKLVVELGQSEYRLLGSPAPEAPKQWQLPVCVSAVGPARTAQCALLAAPSGAVELEARCPISVFLNADAAGYYRSELDPKQLETLAKSGPKMLSERERTMLVGDAWAGVLSGALGIDGYLDTLPHFAGEPSAVVWEQISRSLFEIESTLVAEAELPVFARWVSNLTQTKARELGFKPAASESAERRLLRKTVLLLAGVLGKDAGVVAEAKTHAERWLENPAGVDSDIANVALQIRSRGADLAWFEALRKKLSTAATPEERLLALGGLTSVEDPQLIERLLGLVIDGTVKIQDTRYIFRPLFERRSSREVTYGWLTAHFGELAPKLPGPMLARMVAVLGNFCDESHVTEFEGFFRPRLVAAEGAEKYLNQAVEGARLCAAMSAHQLPRLRKWLARRPKVAGRFP